MGYCVSTHMNSDELNRKLDLICDYMNIETIDYKTIESGANNWVIIVNDTYIFRFSKDGARYEGFKREAKLLDYIRPHMSINIPNAMATERDNVNFAVHNLIEGVEFATLKKEERDRTIPNLAKSVATFFAELHSVENTFLPVKNYKFEDWQCYKHYYYINQFAKKHKKLKIVESIIEKYIDISGNLDPKNNVITHNDLHNGNILINPKDYSLAGIIDFDNAICNNYNHDFTHLDEALLPAVVDEYERLTQKKVDLDFVYTSKKMNLLGRIAKAIFNKEKISERYLRKFEALDLEPHI